MSGSLSAIEKVRVEVGKKRLRINDRFQDFDKLRSGVVTIEQFRRCLTNVGCNLPEADVAALIGRFPGKLPNTVNYGSFTEEVERQEAPVDLLSSLRTRPQALDGATEASIAQFNDGVVQRVLATGVDVFSFFKDFDKHNSGVVTEAQYDRCFPFQVEPRVLAALKQKYRDGKGNVLYFGWCKTISELVQDAERSRSPTRANGEEENVSPSRAHFHNPGPDAAASLLVSTIRQQMATQKLRCEDVLLDYDKARTGTVAAGQFFSALGRLKFVKFQLTQSHLETLAKAYGNVDSAGVLRVHYMAFLHDVMPAGVPITAAAASSPRSDDSFNATLALVPLPEAQERQALAVLEKVKRIVETCRISLKPVLQDFDRSIKGVYQTRTCTKSRFQRALAINKIVLSSNELELLCKRYAVAGADGCLSDDINYVVFCRDVESNEVVTAASGRTHTQLLPVGLGVQSATTADTVLVKVASQVTARKVRLSEFLKDFDPLRGGTVQRDKFTSALAIAGIKLDHAEMEILAQKYASDRVANHVEVARFLADLDNKGLSSITSIASGSYSSGSLRGVINGGSLSGSESAAASASLSGTELSQLATVLQRLSDHVKHHGLLLPPFFVDYDRHHTGRITKAQFSQTLSRHKLPLSEADSALLVRAYGDSQNLDKILYRSFIGDVDEAENVSLQLAIRSASRKPLSPRRESRRAPTDALVEATLTKVADFVVRRNVRLDEFFQDGDGLRHRCISSCRFRGSLGVIGLSLSEEELSALEQAYHTDRILNGVDYIAFSAEVHRRTQQLISSQGKLPLANSTIVSSDNGDFDAVMDGIKKTFAARRLSVRPMIQDFDKMRKGTVTEAQFLSCLTACGIRLSQKDIIALRKRLEMGDGLVTYHKFCDAVDTNK